MLFDVSPHAALAYLFFGFFAGLGWGVASFLVAKITSRV